MRIIYAGLLCVLSLIGSIAAQAQDEPDRINAKITGSIDVSEFQKAQQKARAFFTQGRWAEAEAAYREALALRFNGNAGMYYARSLEMQGKEKEALEAYRKAVGAKADPGGMGNIWYGQLAEKLRRPGEAVPAYTRFLQWWDEIPGQEQQYLGQEPPLRRLRTVALVVAGSQSKEDERLAYLRAAVASDANCASALLALGEALSAPGHTAYNPTEARELLEKAARRGRGSVRDQANAALKRLPETEHVPQ